MKAVKTIERLRVEKLSRIDAVVTFDDEAPWAWKSASVDASRG
jgi:hypothetical protein